MSDDEQPDDPSFEDIEKLLARLAPPETPLDAVDISPQIVLALAQLNPEKTVEIYAGLMTDPRFQANTTRLDWAIRFVLGYARGQRRPKQADISQFLNHELTSARIAQLEDPIEDFFTESLPTRNGDYLLISGYWEKAALHTETVITAFGDLPDAPIKEASLRRAFALLRLSTAIVERAGLERRTVGGGDPNSTIQIPSEQRLNALVRRVRFDWDELTSLGIDKADLRPFFILPSDGPAILTSVPGNSPLEFKLLLARPHGISVAAPANLSTAIRSHLIDVAVSLGMRDQMHFYLFRAQALLMEHGHVQLRAAPPIRKIADTYFGESIQELSVGRYVHVIHSVDGFEHWPQRAFGSVTQVNPQWSETLFQSIRDQRARVSALPGFVEGITIWFAGGWGAGRSFGLPQTEYDPSWPLILLEPCDAAILSACEDAATSDLWRLQKQVEVVSEQGFEFANFSGFLNLLGWWQSTEHALVPPQRLDITPPTLITFPSDLILNVRKEGSSRFDRRAVQHPSGAWHFVAKLDRGVMGKAFPRAYASLDEVLEGGLIGVCLYNDSSWWIELDKQIEKTRDVFETWRTVVLWVSTTMPAFLASVKPKQIVRNLRFEVKISGMLSGGESLAEKTLTDEEIDAGLTLSVDQPATTATIELHKNWFQGFYRPDNYAEVSLAAHLLLGASRIFGRDDNLQSLRSLAAHAAGSTDFRHRHAFNAEMAVERLSSSGLAGQFKKIPISAGALVKCGSAWPSHPRSSGLKIEGKDACVAFLKAFHSERLEHLRAEVHKYDRQEFAIAILSGHQAAIANGHHWARSARALRAIHGVSGDFRESLENSIWSNGVIRANSILLEMAASDAPSVGGRKPGKMDIEELQAMALQLFHAGDTLPAFLADRVEPNIHISPTGDVLYQHEFEEATVQATAELRHAKIRQYESEDYVERFSPSKPAREHIDLEEAIKAEYGITAGYVRGFPLYLVDICRARGEGVLVMTRSELLRTLVEPNYLKDQDFSQLVDRLTLPSRSSWHELLPGMRPADIDLAKFDRRFSPIARPIIMLAPGDDPVLAIAPGVVERALSHNVSGAYAGVLQNDFWQSREMKTYASVRGSATGLEFNEDIAKTLTGMGLKAWSSMALSDCLNQKNTDELKRLGDVDVLAITTDGKQVWAIEAKDLKLCRTVGEAARRLSEYRGVLQRDGKPDKLMRHLQRVDHLRANIDALKKRMKLQAMPAVHGIVVVNSPQPMQQLRREYSEDSTTVILDDLASVPWDRGWR